MHQLPPALANERQCTLYIILDCNEIRKYLEEDVMGDDLGGYHGEGQGIDHVGSKETKNSELVP